MAPGCGLRGRPALLWGVTLLANFCGALNGGVITLTIPTLADEFDCSVETAAWVAFAPNFFAAMFGPALGKAADTWGRSKAWWGGMTLFVLSFVICAWSTPIEMMVAGRTLSGIAWATTGPAGFGILASTLESLDACPACGSQRPRKRLYACLSDRRRISLLPALRARAP